MNDPRHTVEDDAAPCEHLRVSLIDFASGARWVCDECGAPFRPAPADIDARPECQDCAGSGVERAGTSGAHLNPCPTCEGTGYVTPPGESFAMEISDSQHPFQQDETFRPISARSESERPVTRPRLAGAAPAHIAGVAGAAEVGADQG